MNENFMNGMTKAAEAKEKPDGHHVRRFLLGNPISSAIEAKKGKKSTAFGKAIGHKLVEELKGAGKGGLIGAGLGAGAGTISAIASKNPSNILHGAANGGVVGSLLGAGYGSLKGNHGAEASKIHAEHSKHKK